jgi:hypothetical protein
MSTPAKLWVRCRPLFVELRMTQPRQAPRPAFQNVTSIPYMVLLKCVRIQIEHTLWHSCYTVGARAGISLPLGLHVRHIPAHVR